MAGRNRMDELRVIRNSLQSGNSNSRYENNQNGFEMQQRGGSDHFRHKVTIF
jgi:hypothetical protein